MLIGQATEKTGSQHPVTCSRLQVDLYRDVEEQKQDTVALSTAEAEYVALSSATQESVWMGRLNTELGNPLKGPVVILEDNQSTIAMARNPQFHGRAKHIDIRHHFVRERVRDGTIVLRYCPTEEMADMLTKGLAHQQFCVLREKAGVRPLRDRTTLN